MARRTDRNRYRAARASLKDEPYWPALAKVVDGTSENTVSTIWSCLAAHAAVLHTDGIQRRRLPDKQFGVFDCQVISRSHDGSSGASRSAYPIPGTTTCQSELLLPVAIKFSRGQPSPASTLSLSSSGATFLFFQGHPEYEADTLLREYRRDIGRFLRSEREHYPAMPQGFFNVEKIAIANEFRDRALVDRRDNLIDSFPMSLLKSGLERTWRTGLIGIYKKWIGSLHARKTKEQTLTPQSRRTRSDWQDSPWSLGPTRDTSRRSICQNSQSSVQKSAIQRNSKLVYRFSVEARMSRSGARAR